MADSIVGSEYDVAVKVTPLKLGTVVVTSDPVPVTAGGMVDLKVKYTATTQDLSFGRIQVTLPTSQIIHPGTSDRFLLRLRM